MTTMIGLALYSIVVGNPTGLHLRCQRDEVCSWLDPADPEHWRKRKHSASTKTNLGVVEKSFSPYHNASVDLGWYCRLRSVHPEDAS